MGKLKVYYNSACPVCDAGIRGQKERMAACPAQAEWIDVHNHADAAKQIGAEREFVRERLHVVDEHGRLHVGAEAVRALMERTPGQRWLARVMGLRLMRPLAGWCYNRFARLLYAWNRSKGHW